MTREEAIRAITSLREQSRYDHIREAVDIAVGALRAQQTPSKLDRSRWDGCEWCNEYRLVVAAFDGWCYCNRCGKPLTEQAWAEFERRINGGTAD